MLVGFHVFFFEKKKRRDGGSKKQSVTLKHTCRCVVFFWDFSSQL